jgi:hypothetical protein
LRASNISASGGQIVTDGLTVSVPTGSVGAAGGELNVLPMDSQSVPGAAAGFQIGSTVYLITLTDSASGTQLSQFTNPIDLELQLSQATIDSVGGDLSRLKLSTLFNNAWVALPCSVSGATLSCSVPHLSLFALVIAPPAAPPLDTAIPNGHFYKQANSFNGAGDTGFSVTDDADANFWSEFQRLGGADRLGYPISQRFTFAGLTTQVFQKTALQWHAELGQAVPLDIFASLSSRGNDGWLDQHRQIPPPADQSVDVGLAPDQVAARHLQMLDAYPALHTMYASDSLAPTLYGLPLAVKDYGQFVTVRFDRAVVRLWTTDVPWAAAGSASVDSAGDLAKSVGLWPDAAMVPAPPPVAETTPTPTDGSGSAPAAEAPATTDTPGADGASVTSDPPPASDTENADETQTAILPASDPGQGQ